MTGERRFCYSLAKELGYINVDQMLSSISGKQLTEWQAFAKVESAEMESATDAKRSLNQMQGR